MNVNDIEDAEKPMFDNWAGNQGERWLAMVDGLEAMMAPIGEALLAQAVYGPGERVVDVGCGGGWSTRRIGEAVGPNGLALGLDISPALVDEARRRGQAAGLGAVSFELGDAATAMPAAAPFDRLFSRFGVMFFADPYGAFANLRAMLREGGRLDMAVWAPVQNNVWMREVVAIIDRHVGLPRMEARAPGPFALAEQDYVRDLLGKAGFTDVIFDAWEGDQHIGGKGSTPESAADFALGSMQIGELARQGGPDAVEAVRRDLVALYQGYEGPEGVALGAKAWLVSARCG